MPSTGVPMTEDLRRNSGTNYKKTTWNGVLGHTLYFSKAQQAPFLAITEGRQNTAHNENYIGEKILQFKTTMLFDHESI